MKVVLPGHRYELASVEGRAPQSLVFIEKALQSGRGFETISDGTTTEEVLWVLIDRTRFLNATLSCRENSIAITKLEEALMWLEKRTADRAARRVEGRFEP
jgi:hypothetical protein